MGKTFGNPFKTEKRDFYTGFIELILVGGITGIATGAIVTIFNVLMHEGEAISKGIYAYVRANPAFIPKYAAQHSAITSKITKTKARIFQWLPAFSL